MSLPLLQQLLTASVDRNGEGTAVIDQGRELSYSELDAASNRLAHVLREHEVASGDRVGIFLDKSIEALIAIYGILKAGGVYVPFDPQAPVARLGYIARNADIRCLVSSPAKQADWPGLVGGGAPLEALVVLDAADPGSLELPSGVRLATSEDVAEAPAHPPRVARRLDDLAYILYTSGSTGDPKGVMLSHRNAMTFVDWAVKEVGVRRSDVLSSHAPLHFDLSIFDLFAAAQAGAPVDLVPAQTSVFPIELARFIASERITIWYSVPSILSMLVMRGNLDTVDLSALRTIIYAGEVFPMKYLARLMELIPHATVYNLFGPTETNVCTFYLVPAPSQAPLKSVPIGKAITGVQAFALDDEGNVASGDDVGELWVEGPSVMHGYWGDPERTARSLSIGSSGERRYRTGDLVVKDSDGNFLFLGRRDAQIKSRGYRIELGDIESALYAHPDVVECAVTAIPDETISNRIKAYVVVRNGVGEPDLVAFCQERLPRYMIPELFEFRTELPKSSTGKIARRALEKT
jgi:amino acid adenylation domain-containing protein